MEMLPSKEILKAFLELPENSPKIKVADILRLFEYINDNIGGDEKLGEHFKIGHSFLMKKNLDESRLLQIWKYAIRPILKEYYFEDPGKVKAFEENLRKKKILKLDN